MTTSQVKIFRHYLKDHKLNWNLFQLFHESGNQIFLAWYGLAVADGHDDLNWWMEDTCGTVCWLVMIESWTTFWIIWEKEKKKKIYTSRSRSRSRSNGRGISSGKCCLKQKQNENKSKLKSIRRKDSSLSYKWVDLNQNKIKMTLNQN